MDGDSTLINLLVGDGSLPAGVAAGDLMYFDGTDWVSRTIPIPFNYASEDITDDTLFADVIPASHLLKTISLQNTSDNPVQVVITTADNSRELLNELIESTPITLTLNISFATLDGIRVTSPDWNGASVNLSLNMEKNY